MDVTEPVWPSNVSRFESQACEERERKTNHVGLQ